MKCDRCAREITGKYYRCWSTLERIFLEDEYLCLDCFGKEREQWALCPVCGSCVPAELVDECCRIYK